MVNKKTISQILKGCRINGAVKGRCQITKMKCHREECPTYTPYIPSHLVLEKLRKENKKLKQRLKGIL